MKNFLLILFLLHLGGCGCCNNEKLDGLWLLAYNQTGDENPSASNSGTLFHFIDDSVVVTSFRDMAIGDFSSKTTYRGKYVLSNQNLSMSMVDEEFNYRVKIGLNEITLILDEETNSKSILKKLPNYPYNNFNISNYFSGSFVMSGDNYKDSIDFVNDSIAIFTGNYNSNFPVCKYEILAYGKYRFLNLHKMHTPIAIIKSCSEDEIILEYPLPDFKQISMRPTKGENIQSMLIGSWTQEFPDNLLPPIAPGITKEEFLFQIKFESNSINIKRYGKMDRLKYNVTGDSKRIYFIDRIFKESGSWKILSISDNTLILRMSKHDGFDEDIITLKKNN